MKNILNRLFNRETLSKKEAKEVFINLSEGKYNPSQMAAFMTIYCIRNITVQELDGFREAMLELCIPINLSSHEYIDLCGTGGDGKDTFNISTLASFVVAGAGYQVTKHGNYGVSSGCGSSNVMEYLGYHFTNDINQLKKQLDQSNICFLHAPLFNPAMKIVAPIRKEIGVKTFFNMLGPMVNPAQPNYQLIGVFNLELARIYAYLYQTQPTKRYTIIHALDGYDEVSLTSNIKIYHNHGEKLITPQYFGINQKLNPNQIKGGVDVKSSATIFKNILNGQGSDAQKWVVISNAALAIQTILSNKSIAECYLIAEESLQSKKAKNAFKKLIASSS